MYILIILFMQIVPLTDDFTFYEHSLTTQPEGWTIISEPWHFDSDGANSAYGIGYPQTHTSELRSCQIDFPGFGGIAEFTLQQSTSTSGVGGEVYIKFYVNYAQETTWHYQCYEEGLFESEIVKQVEVEPGDLVSMRFFSHNIVCMPGEWSWVSFTVSDLSISLIYTEIERLTWAAIKSVHE